MAYVPPEKQTTLWKLFNKLFMVRVPNIQMCSVDYIKNFGMPTSGFQEIDHQAANELKTTMLPLCAEDGKLCIVELWAAGSEVHVCKHTDTKTMYELISSHLAMWKHQLEHGLNNANAPMEDLDKMAKFAASVYKHAEPQMVTPVVESWLARHFGQQQRSLILNRTSGIPVASPLGPDGKEERMIPLHEDLSDLFTRRRRSLRS